MDITVRQPELLRALAAVQGIPPAMENALPILRHARFEALDSDTVGDALRVSATDLDNGLRVACPAQVRAKGDVLLLAKKAHEIVRSLPDAEVQIEAEADGWVRISCPSASVVFRLAGLPVGDYPSLPAPRGKDEIEMPARLVRELIARTVFAMEASDTRYHLAGGLLVLEPEGVAMVATDGHRLPWARAACKVFGLKAPTRVLVPRKAVVELAKLLDDAGGDEVLRLEVAEARSSLFFSIDGSTLSCKTIEGQFPKFEQVIATPTERVAVATVDREALHQATKRVVLLVSERSRGVALKVGAGAIRLDSSDQNNGAATETVPCAYEGEPVAIGFNARYLADFLHVAGTKDVTLTLRDAESQGLLQPGATDGGIDYRYVVMPMKL